MKEDMAKQREFDFPYQIGYAHEHEELEAY